jgi:hypothetical protein
VSDALRPDASATWAFAAGGDAIASPHPRHISQPNISKRSRKPSGGGAMDRTVRSRSVVALTAAALLAGPIAGPACAEETTTFWAVTGVAAGDVLHLRDVPSAESRSLANIPPNARGLRHLGCRRNQPALEEWMHMNAAQRQAAQTLWCRVEYRGKEGWVAGRYLRVDSGPRP